MDARSNATRLKQMGILDIIAAAVLVGMGAMIWTTELNAVSGSNEMAIQLAQVLVVTGVLFVPMGILSTIDASRRTAATTMAACICACVVTVGSAAYASFVLISQRSFLAWSLIGVVIGIANLILIRKEH